nr:DUF1549 domain-containing protein [uncultured Halomonas sp.]
MLRRVTYGLVGLPPTPGEIELFLADLEPGALSRVVDRLLASSRYGQRWGRHWLDVARYADSNGFDENVAHGNAWRYRDYVVDSFNRDTPFDEFVIEQLAGDLMPFSGQQQQHRRIADPLRQAELRGLGLARLRLGRDRMADEIALHPVGLHQLRLEREERQHMVDHRRHRAMAFVQFADLPFIEADMLR